MKTNVFATRTMGVLILLPLMLLSLCGCHSLFGGGVEDKKVQGDRLAVLEATKKIKPDTDLADYAIELPTPDMTEDWPQMGGDPTHARSNMLIGPAPKKIWRASIGSGTGGDYRLLALPVLADGRLFAMDAKGRVTGLSLDKGQRQWRFDTTPDDQDSYAVGGGLAYADGYVYATTGFGDVIAIEAQTGHQAWRQRVGKPLRAAPSIDDGRLYVVAIDNELTALAAKDGQILWQHHGIVENATLMGASSPAIQGDNVIVAYSSGEIFSLRAQNGRVAWTDILAAPAQVGALPAIADIKGLPVISQNTVYAISHSDRMAAIDVRTGERLWDADIGGVNTPAMAENALYVVSNESQLVALTRKGGHVLWTIDLPRQKNPNDKDSPPVLWWGPILAGGRLWLTNSIGQLGSFATDDGAMLSLVDVADAFFHPPIVANNIMYLLADDGDIYALK